MNLLQRISMSTEVAYYLKKKYFINLLQKGLLNSKIQKRVNSDHLIYKYETEGRAFKNSLGFFKNLTNGNINQREIIKNWSNLKSNLGVLRKRSPAFKSEKQISKTQNVNNFFYLREKIRIMWNIINNIVSWMLRINFCSFLSSNLSSPLHYFLNHLNLPTFFCEYMSSKHQNINVTV